MIFEVAAAFLSGAVAPDAWTRAINRVARHGEEYRALTRSVETVTGLKPGDAYRRWFEESTTWDALVQGRPETQARLVESLERELAKDSAEPEKEAAQIRDAATRLVAATIFTLIESMQPSRAIAIGTERLSNQISDLAQMIAPTVQVSPDLTKFPPATRRPLQDLLIYDMTAARNIISLRQTSEDPVSAFRQLASSPSAWLSSATPTAWVVIGSFLQSHGALAEAGNSFRAAANGGLDRVINLCRAALCFASVDRKTDALVLLSEADTMSGRVAGDTISLTRALIENDAASALAIAPPVLELDVFLAGPLLGVIYAKNGPADAARASRELMAKYPEHASFRIRALEYTVTEARETNRPLAYRVRTSLVDDALEARRLLREWDGPSEDAVALACEICLMTHDLKRVLMLGLSAPRGEATIKEANAEQVLVIVAETAIYLGDSDLAVELQSLLRDPFHQHYISATLADHRRSDIALVKQSYLHAWGHCRNDVDRYVIWHRLAFLGGPLPDRDKLDKLNDANAALILAQYEAKTGATVSAISRLRLYRNRSPLVIDLLKALLVDAGEVDEAVEVLKAAAKRFTHPEFLAEAAELLARQIGFSAAEDLAIGALSALSVGHHLRVNMHEILIASAQNAELWGAMEIRARALLEESTAASEHRWFLVGALFNQRKWADAWESMREPQMLRPVTAVQASVWIHLNCKYRTDKILANEIFDLLDEFVASADFVAGAIGEYLRWANTVSLDDSTVIGGRERIERFIAENPNHSAFRAISTPSDMSAEALSEQFRDLLEPHARQLVEVAKQVAELRLPHALLARQAGRPYALVYAHRAAGCVPISNGDERLLNEELECAKAAIDKPVVIETSSIAINYYIAEVWPRIVASFSRIVVLDSVRSDIAVAFESVKEPSAGTIGWDLDGDHVRVTEADPDARAQLQEHLAWMERSSNDLDVVDWASLTHIPDLAENGSGSFFAPWLTSVDYAVEAGIPLYVDDFVLRQVARSLGVQAFGTVALISALANSGRLTSDDTMAFMTRLRREWCVDLPLDFVSLWKVAEQDDWKPAAACFAFSRARTWSNPKTFRAWLEFTRKAYSVDPTTLPGWLHAGVLGVTRLMPYAQALTSASWLLAMATTTSEGDPQKFKDCLRATRLALTERSALDVLPHYVEFMRSFYEPTHGAQQTVLLIRSVASELDESDRMLVREVLFTDRGE